MPTHTFTPFPKLTTHRLTLRQLSTADQESILSLRSNQEVNKYLGRAASQTLEEAKNFINKVNDNVKNNTAVYWVICLTHTRTVVGTICLYNFSVAHNSCEIGYELMPDFKRQGIMSEATEAVIDYAFQTLAIKKIVAFSHHENLHSTTLLKKINFVPSEEVFIENPNIRIFTLTNAV